MAECVQGDTRPICDSGPVMCSDGVTVKAPPGEPDNCPIKCPNGSIIRLGGSCANEEADIVFPEFDFSPSPDAVGFYTPEYPEGFTTVWASNEQALKSSALVASVSEWSQLNISGSLDIDFGKFCFDFGFANFGCFSVGLPDFVISFLRAVMLFSCAIQCRKIVVGG